MKTISRITLIAALAALFTVSPSAASNLSGISGAFADVGLGLRPVGMGGAYTALATDENATRWNPSLLADVWFPSAAFSWAKQFGVVNYSYAAFAMPVNNALGAGAYFISAGDDVYSETTIGLGAGVTGGQIMLPEDLRVGGTLKIYTTSFGNDPEGGAGRVTGSSSGFGLDLAASYKPLDELTLSVVDHDLINSISWKSSVKGSYSEGLPNMLTLAAAYEDAKMAYSIDLEPSLYDDVPTRFGIGTELTLFGVLKPRLGMTQNLSSDDLNRWVTLGLGIEFQQTWIRPLRSVKFGYTQMMHNIASTPRVGLALVW